MVHCVYTVWHCFCVISESVTGIACKFYTCRHQTDALYQWIFGYVGFYVNKDIEKRKTVKIAEKWSECKQWNCFQGFKWLYRLKWRFFVPFIKIKRNQRFKWITHYDEIKVSHNCKCHLKKHFRERVSHKTRIIDFAFMLLWFCCCLRYHCLQLNTFIQLFYYSLG